jgi:predicted acyltransferase
MTEAVLEARPREQEAPDPLPIAAEPPQRLLSLDVFRGITIAGMLLVNNPGSWSAIYAPLEHAKWNGWTPTDLIFPFFVFIVGVALTYSFGKLQGRGASRSDIFMKVVKRAVIIFALGLIMQGFPHYDLSHIRIMGILQRIALCYLFASAIFLTTDVRGTIIAAATLLLVYWAAMLLIPVPGIGAGWLQPGRNLAAYIDLHVIGVNHNWAESKTWDPEGILSTIPAIATALLGVLAGHWLRSKRTMTEKALGLLLAGNIGMVAGVIWGIAFPINKSIWTSSYVIFTAGMACSFLAVCYWLVDMKGYRRWATPFVVFGTNAIFTFWVSAIFARTINLFMMTSPVSGKPVTARTWFYQTTFESWLSPINASLAFALFYVVFWMAIVSILYRKRIFIKV